jgi:hypothetical protein
VSSSGITSEFMTTRRSMRSGCRAAKARAGWPPMSRPTSEARAIRQWSSSASTPSAMCEVRVAYPRGDDPLALDAQAWNAQATATVSR